MESAARRDLTHAEALLSSQSDLPMSHYVQRRKYFEQHTLYSIYAKSTVQSMKITIPTQVQEPYDALFLVLSQSRCAYVGFPLVLQLPPIAQKLAHQVDRKL